MSATTLFVSRTNCFLLQILVAEGFVCKLGDFGESKDLRQDTMTVVG